MDAPEPLKLRPEIRRSPRLDIAQPLRVRPSGPVESNFEDTPASINVSKEGIFFRTRRPVYFKHMRLFVTFPFTSSTDPRRAEYVAEVVRIENLPHGRFGIAIHLISTV